MESEIAMKTLIYLGAAIVMVPLARKMGLSSVIGYIVGGIIIGPFVLKLTGQDIEDIMHASEFGVVVLLFMIGLELEPKKFWALRKRIIGLGVSQMLLTIGILFIVLVAARWPTNQAITVAMCFAMSSTAIVLQTLQEKNMFRTSGGQAAFSTLIFQDMAVIPILAILPFIAHFKVENNNEVQLVIQKLPEWMQAATVIFGVIFLILFSKYLFVPFLRYVSKSGMPELLTASSLFLVVGVSELMVSIGLSPALGAFLAGVMLANSEFRHELEAQLDPFKGLLLAVFFVSVGSTINFLTIQKDPVLIFSLAFVVLLVKFSVLFAIGKFFRIEKRQNYFYAFALSQVGEFAFVLLSYSSQLFLLDNEMTSQMMAVTAITMFITPVLLILHEKILVKKLNKDKNQEKPYHIMDGQIRKKKIIIVGFGHFGSTVGRLLKANKISATVLDHDTERVKLLRSYGFDVFYGDATRMPILKAAGIDTAEILVLCLDNPEDNKLITELVQEQFPHIKIFVRAKNRNDSYYYLNHGIETIYRETLGTAVEMAIDLLHETGMRKYAARRMGKRFMLIDKGTLKRFARDQEDDLSTFTMKEALKQEEALLAYDSMTFETHDWIDRDDDDETDDGENEGKTKDYPIAR